MWKCIRCEKENQDSEENCTACGHGKTMDYTGHRTLSKISSSVADNWKSSQSDPEYFKAQALKHLKEAAELLEKSGFRGAAAKINEVITEVEQYSPRKGDRKKEKSEKQQRTIRVLNQDELDKRKNRRTYTGNSIKEICENFLSCKDNEWINGGYYKDVKIEFSEESFLFFGDSEKSGFAITEKGIYSKDVIGTAVFLSWENFGAARVMYPGNGVLKIKGNNIVSIAYLTEDRESLLQIEMLFIAIHRYLNKNTSYMEQETDVVKNKTPNIRIVENHQLTQQNTNSFRVGGQNVLGKDTNPASQEKTEIQKQQNPNAFRYGGQNVLGKETNPSGSEKTVKKLEIINYDQLKKRKYNRIYKGNSIEKICLNFLSYEENKSLDTGRKDNIINTLKIPSDDTIYLIHDDSWFKRGKNGFAVTDRGLYVKDDTDMAVFVSWEEFRECENIKIGSCCIVADGKKLAYLSSGNEIGMQLECMLIAIHELLNEKEN